MGTTREYTEETCPECGDLMHFDVMEIGNIHSSPRYRKDGPSCDTEGCMADRERRLTPGYTTHY